MIPLPAEQPTVSVEEAANAYGIGRAAAYAACRRFLDTDGAEGIPTLSIGRFLRCPTAAIRAQLGLDQIAPGLAESSAAGSGAPPSSADVSNADDSSGPDEARAGPRAGRHLPSAS